MHQANLFFSTEDDLQLNSVQDSFHGHCLSQIQTESGRYTSNHSDLFLLGAIVPDHVVLWADQRFHKGIMCLCRDPWEFIVLSVEEVCELQPHSDSV